jgi:calcium-dependent protein kinase
VLQYFSEKIEIKPHEIIKTFKNIDGDFDGFITREEVVEAFQIVGIDASGEINGIMSNIDIDSSGFLDFTEIKIALTKWDQMIKVKTLKKIFKNENEMIQLQSLKHLFPEILPHEWNEFAWKVKAENGIACTDEGISSGEY